MADYIDGVHSEIRETQQQTSEVQQSLASKAVADYAQVYGIFRRIATSHDEVWVLSEEIDFVSIDFFKNDNKLETLHQVSLVSGTSLTLDTQSTPVILDDCDSTMNWVEAEYNAEGNFSLDTQVKYQGDASIKVTITKTGLREFRYRIRKILSPSQDWSNYDLIKVWVRGSPATNFGVRLCINGKDFVSSDFIVSGDSWVQLSFDIGTYSGRDSVSDFGFQFTREAVQYSCNFDLVELVDVAYYESGYAISKTVSLDKDVEKVFLGVYDLSPPDTWISYDISLDGGTHWKSNILPESWLSTLSGGVLETPDTGTWNNKRNLKLRMNLFTTSSSYTPELDDYILMWKKEE